MVSKHQAVAVSGLTQDQNLKLNIVMMEARFLSEILFATQAVMKHMSWILRFGMPKNKNNLEKF